MKIVECPRCRDEVTVPARARAQTLVRCPLCLEEYLLREALDELPPMLVVLDGSAGDDEPELVGTGAPLRETSRMVGEVGDEYRVAGGFGGALDASPAPGATVSPVARPGVKGTRPKRKEKSAIFEIMKVVVGGVVGCGLALLVLWWIAGRDDFKLGPKVAPYAPWIVPAKFHGKLASAGADSASVDPADPARGSPPATQSTNKGSNGQSGDLANQGGGLVSDLPTDLPFPDPTKPADPLSFDDPLASVGGTTSTAPIEPNPAPLNPEPEPEPVKPSKAKNSGKSAKAKPPEADPTPEPELPAATDKALPSANDFAQAVVAAADGLAKVNESKGQPVEVRQQLYTDMYQAGAEAGRIVTYLSSSDSDLIEQVNTLQTFLTALAGDKGKVGALKSLTDLKMPERKHDDGVLLAALAQDFQAAGSMFELTMLAGKKGTETPVIFATNPQDICAPGDELLIVGRIVENPQKHIPGYEGDHERVVLFGYGVKVPKADDSPAP